MKRGTTLIEMLVAITISAIILAVTVQQFLMQKGHVERQENQIKVDRDTRLTLMFIGEELREIGLDPKKTHAFGITEGFVDTLRYRIDRNQDGVVDPADIGDIHLNGDVLVFNNDSILSDVTLLQFTYFDEGGNTIAIPPTINESDPTGFFTDTVATINIRLVTEKRNPRNRLIGHSDQLLQIERKNR